MRLGRRGRLWVDSNDVVDAKLPQLGLGDVGPALVGRGVGGARVHHAVELNPVDIVRSHGLLGACVGILAHGDDVLHLEETHHVQEGLVTEGVQLPQHLDRHVGGGHVLASLRHEGQGTQVVDGTRAEEALCCWAQPSEQLPKAGPGNLGYKHRLPSKLVLNTWGTDMTHKLTFKTSPEHLRYRQDMGYLQN